jgi:hypothetical protein
MTARKRMLARVRDYMADLGGRRERLPEVPPELIEQVHLYVSEVEQVLDGTRSSAVVMRTLRQEFMDALGRMEAIAGHRAAVGRDADLESYISSARNYAKVLEYRLNHEQVGDGTVALFRGWYEQGKRKIDERQPR